MPATPPDGGMTHCGQGRCPAGTSKDAGGLQGVRPNGRARPKPDGGL